MRLRRPTDKELQGVRNFFKVWVFPITVGLLTFASQKHQVDTMAELRKDNLTMGKELVHLRQTNTEKVKELEFKYDLQKEYNKIRSKYQKSEEENVLLQKKLQKLQEAPVKKEAFEKKLDELHLILENKIQFEPILIPPCAGCGWQEFCADAAKKKKELSLIYRMTRQQRELLISKDIKLVTNLI